VIYNQYVRLHIKKNRNIDIKIFKLQKFFWYVFSWIFYCNIFKPEVLLRGNTAVNEIIPQIVKSPMYFRVRKTGQRRSSTLITNYIHFTSKRSSVRHRDCAQLLWAERTYHLKVCGGSYSDNDSSLNPKWEGQTWRAEFLMPEKIFSLITRS